MGGILGKTVEVTGQEQENRLATLWNEVLENSLILDKIVDYVIHHKGQVLSAEVRATRLVNRQWLSTTNKILAKTPKAVFRVPLTRENSTSATAYVQEHGKVLHQFMRSSLLCDDKWVPLFVFNASPDFFQHEDNHQELLDCLTEYGGNLVELQVALGTCPSLKPLSPGTWLPNLRSLSVGTTQRTSLDSVLHFSASVIDASPKLTAMNFTFPDLFSNGLEMLVLPPAITDISLSTPFLGYCLDAFDQHALPNLKRLQLQGDTRGSTPEQLFNLLNSVSETLEEFSLSGDKFCSYFPNLRIPFMKKLETFRIDIKGVRLAEDHVPLQLVLPSLKHLTLRRYVKFGELMAGCHSDSVTSLTVSSYCPLKKYSDFINVCSIAEAFPKLVKLDMTIEGTSASMLRKCWHKLGGLQELRIRVFCHSQHVSEQNYWDQVLTGYSVDTLGALDKIPSTTLENETRYSSIADLTVLEKLHLETVEKYNISFISDAAFKLALLKMPKLSQLTLSSNFSASREMREAWEKQGAALGIQRKLIVDADK